MVAGLLSQLPVASRITVANRSCRGPTPQQASFSHADTIKKGGCVIPLLLGVARESLPSHLARSLPATDDAALRRRIRSQPPYLMALPTTEGRVADWFGWPGRVIAQKEGA